MCFISTISVIFLYQKVCQEVVYDILENDVNRLIHGMNLFFCLNKQNSCSGVSAYADNRETEYRPAQNYKRISKIKENYTKMYSYSNFGNTKGTKQNTMDSTGASITESYINELVGTFVFCFKQ